LKVTGIGSSYISQTKGVDTLWFHFRLTYKNFGPSPAEGIFFKPFVFVAGQGPAPKQACSDGPGWITHKASADIVFPQDEGDGDWGVQVSLQRLKQEAARTLAVQPSSPIYIIVVGCLLYHSGASNVTYVTGVVADLYLNDTTSAGSEVFVSLYNVLTVNDSSQNIGVEVKPTDAWAD